MLHVYETWNINKLQKPNIASLYPFTALVTPPFSTV